MIAFVCAAVLLGFGPVRVDDPKKDEEEMKGKVAVLGADTLVVATKKYYLENGGWPKKLKDVTAYLENGEKGLVDPWGKEYKFEVREEKADDGTTIQRPYVWTERVVGKETKVYGKKPPEKKDEKKEKKDEKKP